MTAFPKKEMQQKKYQEKFSIILNGAKRKERIKYL